MALHLFGGLNTNQIRALTWGDIIFDDCEPDKVIVRLRDDERSGSTHKLDRPIFPMGARILRARYQSLLEDGASKSALRGQKVAVRQNGVVFPASEITRYIVRILKSIELSAEYYSRKEPGKILRPNELLGSTYRYMVHYTCGLGAMEPGTANYLCGKSLTGNTTDDNYTSFSSPEGLERLYAYMHRLCVSEPLPQCIPPQVSEDGSKEALCRTCRRHGGIPTLHCRVGYTFQMSRRNSIPTAYVGPIGIVPASTVSTLYRLLLELLTASLYT